MCLKLPKTENYSFSLEVKFEVEFESIFNLFLIGFVHFYTIVNLNRLDKNVNIFITS